MFYKTSNGFTLVELLISLAISTIVLSAIYNLFISNNIIYLNQTELAKMEQNLRSGFSMLRNDIIMSGYDPIGIYNNTLGINTDSSTEETIIVSYYDDKNGTARKLIYDTYDSDTYGDDTLARREVDLNEAFSSTNRQPIMGNVRNIKFEYCDKDYTCNSTASIVSDICHVNIFLETYSSRNSLDIPDLNMTRTVYIRNACLED